MHCCSWLLDKYGSRQRSVGSMPLAGMAAGRSVLGRWPSVPTIQGLRSASDRALSSADEKIVGPGVDFEVRSARPACACPAPAASPDTCACALSHRLPAHRSQDEAGGAGEIDV